MQPILIRGAAAELTVELVREGERPGQVHGYPSWQGHALALAN